MLETEKVKRITSNCWNRFQTKRLKVKVIMPHRCQAQNAPSLTNGWL